MVLGLVVAWLGVSAFLLVSARSDAEDGRRALRDARRTLEVEDLIDGTASETLRAVGAHFDAARDGFESPVIAPLRALPVVGRQIRSADALATAGDEIMEMAATGVDDARSLIEDGFPRGSARIDLLRELADLADSVGEEVAAVDLGPDDALIGSLRSARDEFVGDRADVLGTITDATRSLDGLADLFDGPSTVLVLAANNAEMRVGSGMFLSIGPLTIESGEIDVGDFRPARDLELDEGVGLDDDMEALYGWAEPDEEWRNLGLTPRFPVNAALAEQMWAANGGGPVDAVLAVDVFALSEMLHAVGPVTVDGETYDADSVVPFLLHDQYEALRSAEDLRDENAARRERLSVVAGEVIRQFAEPGRDVSELATRLRRAVRGRHLMGWSGDDAIQDLWATVGMQGTLDERSLMVGVANQGGSKLDQYLETTVAMTTEVDDNDPATTVVNLDLTIANRAPDDDPAYILGQPEESGVAAGTYRGWAVFNVPASAGDIEEVDAEHRVVASGPDGPTTAAAFAVEVPAGSADTVRIRFRLDRALGTIRVEPDARSAAIHWTVNDNEEWRNGRERMLSLDGT